MPYRYLPDVSRADLAFEAKGDTLHELFAEAAKATEGAMVKLEGVRPEVVREFALRGDALDRLLHDWLEELITLKDSEVLLFSRFDVKVTGKEGDYALTAKAWGERIDYKRHELGIDVKACTWHMLTVEKTEKGWRCLVILDV